MGKRSNFKPHKLDAYATPEEAVLPLLPHLPKGSYYAEPCAGDGALIEYEMVTGNKVEACAFYQYEHWLGASPDGLVGDYGLVEIKCPFGIRYKNPPIFKTAAMQTHYYAQMQIQLFCANRDWCDFYQWTPYGDALERIELDPSFLNTVLPVLRSFYEKYLIERELPNAEKYLDGQAQ